MDETNAKNVVKKALECYAQSLGVTIKDAIYAYKTSETTRECISLLVLCQADANSLRKIASSVIA